MRDLEQWLLCIGNETPKHVLRGLEPIRHVAARLGLLHHDIFNIHVGGTNGKGSTVLALAATYQHAGYRVGAYFSPHLFNVNERIQCQGVSISDKHLVEAFEAIASVLEDTVLSYFEWLTLAAVWYFVKEKVDIAVMEIGLGGRLDAVNAWEPKACVLTTIALDHQDILGNSLEEIAFEKAAIMRKGIPAVITKAAQHPVVLTEMARIGAKGILKGNNSLEAALALVEELQERLPYQKEGLDLVLKKARLPGRFQVFQDKCIQVFDVAHNPEGVCWLLEQCAVHFPGTRIHAVWSSLGDKALEAMVAEMKPFIDTWYIAALTHPRASALERLKQALNTKNIQKVKMFQCIKAAYQGAVSDTPEREIVLVFGSFYTVSACLQARQEIWNESLKNVYLEQPSLLQ